MANNETYVEWLVKRRNTAGGTALKYLLTALCVISALAMFLIPFASLVCLILAVVFGVVAYFAGLNADVEFEYLYLDREITIDKVMGKSKRKRVGKFSTDKMEVLAPMNSHHLDSYKNRNLKTLDYSSMIEEQPDKRYMMVYSDEGGTKLIVLEPNDVMVKAIKTIAPRKVFND